MSVVIYGKHAVEHALRNKNRKIHQVIKDEKRLSKMKITHQGFAIETEPLIGSFADISGNVLLIDKVQDLGNLGAIIRTAASFSVRNILLSTSHHCPNIFSSEHYGLIAKIACGGLEFVNLVKINNTAQSMEKLKQKGYWIVGLDEKGQQMGSIGQFDKVCLVIGQEEKGLRQLTKQKCDLMIRIPTTKQFGCLNASVAAAIGMFVMQNVMQN